MLSLAEDVLAGNAILDFCYCILFQCLVCIHFPVGIPCLSKLYEPFVSLQGTLTELKTKIDF